MYTKSVCTRQKRLDENAVLAGERAPLRRERSPKGGLGAQRGVQVGKMASGRASACSAVMSQGLTIQVFEARVFDQRLETATIRLVRNSEHEAHHKHDHKCASEDHHLHVEIVRNRGGRRLVNDAAR